VAGAVVVSAAVDSEAEAVSAVAADAPGEEAQAAHGNDEKAIGANH